MEFWDLEGTNYVSDYKRSFINGQIEHPFSLPSVQCKVCRQSMGDDCGLPYKCPANLRERFSNPVEVTIEEFNLLANKVKAEVRKQGLSDSFVQPGCLLQPAFLDIASKPTADFLWPGFSPLVSQRIRDKLQSLNLQDIAITEVTMRKVGKKSAKLAPPIPSTGEPEDIVNEVATTRYPKMNRKYFELCVYGRSAPSTWERGAFSVFGLWQQNVQLDQGRQTDYERVHVDRPTNIYPGNHCDHFGY
jgi:hypothetical protein